MVFEDFCRIMSNYSNWSLTNKQNINTKHKTSLTDKGREVYFLLNLVLRLDFHILYGISLKKVISQ